MGITYEKADDIKELARRIVFKLSWFHIDLKEVGFVRSFGSQARGTIARCHAMGKAMQLALDRKGYYLIEVISKNFDKLPEEEKIKVVIHELMHIPKSFGGGFIHHDNVHERSVREAYEQFKRKDKDMSNYY
jgi:predicted metallopeptidase